jgi:predicted NUDIX family phosphoesterase
VARLRSEFLSVAAIVLRQTGIAMTPKQIVDYAIEHGLFTDRISGRTPHQTMKSKLSVDVRRRSGQSLFARTRPGAFSIRNAVSLEAVYEAKPYSRAPDQSDVRVISPDRLDSVGRFQGIQRKWQRYASLLERRADVEYQSRAFAETTEQWKQVLTYVLVTRKGKVLCFRRGNFSRVEDNLRGSLCIGFGGHVTREDFDLLALGAKGVLRSAARELAEELRLPAEDVQRLATSEGLEIVGVLNDDSSVVGRKHIAFILRYEVSESQAWLQPVRGEKSIAQLHWIEPESITYPIWHFEYWSQLCLRTFLPKISKSTPAYRLIRRARLRDARVIFVMGTVGSGKTEAASLIAQYTDRVYINSGEIVADLLGIGVVTPENRDEFQSEALSFIQRSDGPARLAKAIYDRIAEAKGAAIVDGVRHLATLNGIYQLLGSRRRTAVIYVHTSPDMAHKFYCARKGNEIPFRKFLETRDAPVEHEVGHFLRVADGVVYNWFGRTQYVRTIRQLVNRILDDA